MVKVNTKDPYGTDVMCRFATTNPMVVPSRYPILLGLEMDVGSCPAQTKPFSVLHSWAPTGLLVTLINRFMLC